MTCSSPLRGNYTSIPPGNHISFLLSLGTFRVFLLIITCTFWQEYKELYKKDLNDLDNPNGLITHLDIEILECGVKWALGSITTSKASRSDGIPVELPQILKDDAFKVLHSITQYASKFGILSSGHRTGNGQFSFQSQRRAIPKNAQITTKFHSSHMLVN